MSAIYSTIWTKDSEGNEVKWIHNPDRLENIKFKRIGPAIAKVHKNGCIHHFGRELSDDEIRFVTKISMDAKREAA